MGGGKQGHPINLFTNLSLSEIRVEFRQVRKRSQILMLRIVMEDSLAAIDKIVKINILGQLSLSIHVVIPHPF